MFNKYDYYDYKVVITGNELRYHIPEELKLKGDVAFLGTGTFPVLFWIKDLIKNKNVEQIPQLWLVDHTRTVITFWQLMQKNAKTSNTFEEFMAGMRNSEAILGTVSRFRKPVVEMQDCMDGLLQEEEGMTSKDLYSYFRKIMLKANIQSDAWENADVFDEIIMTKKPKTPIVVYASNILECTGVYKKTPEVLKEIVKNILTLNPTYTLHGRTTISRYEDLMSSLAPEATILLHGKATWTAHLGALHESDLIGFYDTEALKKEAPQHKTRLVEKGTWEEVLQRARRYYTDEERQKMVLFTAPSAVGCISDKVTGEAEKPSFSSSY